MRKNIRVSSNKTKTSIKKTSRSVASTKNKIKKDKIFSNNNSIRRLYVSFNTRVFIFFGLSLSFLILSLLLIIRSFSVSSSTDINYQENSNLDYKVYLKENDFYENKYLGKNMVYVASLIDKININFNYLFKIDKESSIDFNYDIMGKLVITDIDGNNTFFEKEYTLLKNTKESMNNQTNFNLEKNIDIDYDYYNNLANKFRNNYGINTNSNLIVYLKISENDAKDNRFRFNNFSVMSLTIPLSEKAINIKMDYNDINNKNKIISDSFVVVNNYVFITFSIACVLMSIYWILKCLRLFVGTKKKVTNYDKYIKKILNEYDRLIVETNTLPDISNNNVIKINSFQELLDVRDNLKLPIKYCVITEHQKCNFYINHMNELYLLVVKAVDMNK